MSILKDIKYSLLKASKTVVDKTGDYSRIAKLSLDIKNFEAEIEKKETETGKYILEKMNNGESKLDLTDAKLTEIKKEIENLKNKQNECRNEINELKSKGKEKDVQS